MLWQRLFVAVGFAGVLAATACGKPTVQAIVDTEGTGCNKEQGQCWLPPYPTPSHDGQAVLAPKAVNVPCQKSAEANCWPQPGDEVTLLCITQGADGLLYYGFKIPGEHLPDNGRLGGTGYNQVQWFKIKTGNDFSTLRSRCSGG